MVSINIDRLINDLKERYQITTDSALFIKISNEMYKQEVNKPLQSQSIRIAFDKGLTNLEQFNEICKVMKVDSSKYVTFESNGEPRLITFG